MKLEIQTATYEKSTSRIFLFCRDSSGKLKTIKQHYRPYLFVPAEINLPENSGILRVEDGYTSIYGEPLKKIVYRTVPDLVESRKLIEHFGYMTYESRIPFVERFLIDKGIKTGIEITDHSIVPTDFQADPRIIWLDIESTTLSIGAEPIVVTGVLDVNAQKIYLITTIKDEPQIERLTHFDLIIQQVNSEAEMLAGLEFLIKRKIDPDLILGFNLSGYDLPFIYKRSPFPIELGRPPYPQLSRYGTIKGRVVLDYEEVWLKMMATELRSHSLAGILDYLKLPYEKVSISNWKQTLRTDPYLILDRNLRDLELCYLIEQQVGLIELMNAIRRYVGCQWKSVLSKSRIAKILLYRKFPEKKFPSGKFEHESYQGAIVIEPQVGIYENIAVIDFKALYPSVILEYQLSPDPYGYLPKIIAELMDLREKFKKKMKSAKTQATFEKYRRLQRAIKFCVNACYGLCAYSGSPLFSVEVASEVTRRARECLMKAKQIVEDLGFKVIYGDTDSLFIQVDSLEQAEELVKQINSRLEKEYRYIRMSLDEYFAKLILLTKKRYAGLVIYQKGVKLEKPKIMKTGLQRTDLARYGEQVMDKVIEMILYDKTDQIADYLKRVQSTLRQVPISDLALPKGLRKEIDDYKVKNIYHQAVEYSNKYLGMEIVAGEKPLFLPIKKVPRGYEFTPMIAIRDDFELPKGFEPDYLLIYKKHILKPIERFLELLNLDYLLRQAGTRSILEFL